MRIETVFGSGESIDAHAGNGREDIQAVYFAFNLFGRLCYSVQIGQFAVVAVVLVSRSALSGEVK